MSITVSARILYPHCETLYLRVTACVQKEEVRRSRPQKQKQYIQPDIVIEDSFEEGDEYERVPVDRPKPPGRVSNFFEELEKVICFATSSNKLDMVSFNGLYGHYWHHQEEAIDRISVCTSVESRFWRLYCSLHKTFSSECSQGPLDNSRNFSHSKFQVAMLIGEDDFRVAIGWFIVTSFISPAVLSTSQGKFENNKLEELWQFGDFNFNFSEDIHCLLNMSTLIAMSIMIEWLTVTSLLFNTYIFLLLIRWYISYMSCLQLWYSELTLRQQLIFYCHSHGLYTLKTLVYGQTDARALAKFRCLSLQHYNPFMPDL